MSIARRQFLFGSLATPLLAKKKELPRPSILLVLADNLGAWTLGCYGNREIRTPNIDELAQTGTRFANCFVCTPASSASRATLFTGRVPQQTGIIDSLTQEPIENPPQGQAAPPPSFRNEIMISDVLSGRGYNCGYVGKWHMGNDQKAQHGYGFWHTSPGAPDAVTSQACQFLDQQRAGQPFFLTVSYFTPEPPYTGLAQKYYDMYAQTKFDTFGWAQPAANALQDKNMLKDIVGNLRKCAAAISAVDDQVPTLLSALHQRQLSDNTLIVWTAANGALLGRHGLWDAGQASNPINMYEEAMKVPMIWSWLGRVPAQNVRPDLVSLYDVFPSLCEAAQAPLPAGRNLCGRSFVPLATNQPLPKKKPWRDLVFGHFRNTEMVRDTRYKAVLRNAGKGPNEFFDLNVDPRERTNQYDNPQFISVKGYLASQLAAWHKLVG